MFLRQTLPWPRLQRTEEFTAHTVIENEKEVILRLERVEQGDDEWVICCCKDFLFRESALDLVSLDHFLFR